MINILNTKEIKLFIKSLFTHSTAHTYMPESPADWLSIYITV